MKLFTPYTILATWFYSGLSPKAPGTFGSLAALPFGFCLLWLNSPPLLLIAIIVVFIIGLWAAHEFEKDHHIADDKRIVIDEVAGQWIAMLPLLYVGGPDWLNITGAFILFRVFDILKPFPISYIDSRIKGAFGVMFDDVVAGIMAGFVLLGIHYALYVFIG